MRKRAKVCVIASGHSAPFEPRIYYREALTLVADGYELVFIVRHSASEERDGLRIVALPAPRNRFDRMTRGAWRAFRLALRERADVYHFHNPEFIPMALLLRLLGKRVIYDVHEAFYDKLRTREYIAAPLRPLVGRLVRALERFGAACFAHVLAADRFVARQFRTGNVTVVANFPVLSIVRQMTSNDRAVPAPNGKTVAIYAGDLEEERGLFHMVEAMEQLRDLDVELRLLGRFAKPVEEAVARRVPSVKYLGYCPVPEVFSHLAAAHIGLVVLQPVPGYLYAGENTNKLFEYMASGLAVVASAFTNLREFVEGNRCGICIDPTSSADLARAIRLLHDNPRMRTEMGDNGRAAVRARYNWELEGRKLLAVYETVLADGRSAAPTATS